MLRAGTATEGMVIRKFASLAFALCLGTPALAAEVAGVTLADKVSVGGQALVLNGAGIRTMLFFKIYVGSLYLPQKAGDLAGVLARGPRRIQMNLLRDLTSDQLVGALVGGLAANNSPNELAAIKTGTDQLVRILTASKDVDVKATDVLTMDFVDGATKVALNGEAKGVIPGAEFNSALTRIWLGDKPAGGNLKKAMLGG
jgi:Chalcone isomerase-like